MVDSFPIITIEDNSYTNSALYAPSEKAYRNVREESAPYFTASGTATTVDTVLMDKWYFEFLELAARTRELSELEIPDIFTLHPLVSQQINIKIMEIKPARFYYVPDIDDE